MKELDTFKKMVELEKKYRLMFANVEDTDEKERYNIDSMIFPKWWFEENDYVYRLKLLSKSLDNKVLLQELEEVKIKDNRSIDLLLEQNLN